MSALAATLSAGASRSLVVLPRWMRIALVLPAVAALLCGMLAGLARLGWPVPGPIGQRLGQLVVVHGALMVGGFFGTLIGLERAVAIGARWAYFAPAMSGLAVIAMLSAAPQTWAALLMSCAALFMFAACAKVWLRQRVAHHTALAIAALAWLSGNIVWTVQGSVLPAVPLWTSFLVLTIAAERLELSRFVPTPKWARAVFGIIVGVLLAGALCNLLDDAGLRIFAAALCALAVWLLRYDIARRTIKTAGLTRYMAICLLSGYAWLAVGALLGVLGGLHVGEALRDAALHALLLGFVFSMVFGHAPVIAPAITRIRFRWHAGFYLPLLALHLTLTVRVVAGIGEWFALRQWAAAGNALVVLLFIAMVVTSLTRARSPVDSPAR